MVSAIGSQTLSGTGENNAADVPVNVMGLTALLLGGLFFRRKV